MSRQIKLEIQVPVRCAGLRFDQAAAELIPDYSRARLQEWIKNGQLRLNGRSAKPKEKLLGCERLQLSTELTPQGVWQAEPMALQVVFEDDSLLVVNKPAGLVVHPAAGNPDGTLLNGLLHYCPQQQQIPRAGIVHRLDKDTSGLMVVAKTLSAQCQLVAQLKARSVSRRYDAIVQGIVNGPGSVDAAIGRHRQNRLKMAVIAGPGGKAAITHYQPRQCFNVHSLLRCQLETGRTHQIRVHMAHIHHPLVGDPVYGGRTKLPVRAGRDLVTALQAFSRQALHAAELALTHPHSGERLHWRAPMPEDMQQLLALLAADAGVNPPEP